jgi:membrane peptidoglycan carboxypeptidase
MRNVARKVALALGAALALVVLYVAALAVTAWRTVGSVVEQARAFDRSGLRVESLPPGWKDVLLEVEDPGFYEHAGVDARTPGAGWTTITQGLAKRYFFEKFEPGIHAKIKQSIAAVVLDRALAKDLQLTLFLNTAGLGPAEDGWVEGFPAAARVYFDKPLESCDRREFVTLVAMLIGPAAYHPVRGREALDDRVARIEALLEGRCAPAGPRDVLYESCSPDALR